MIGYILVALIAFHVGFLAAAILASASHSDHIAELHPEETFAPLGNEELEGAYQC